MTRIFALGLWFSLSALAQFQDLSTNQDGTVIYFSSRLRQKSLAQNDNYKVFRVDGSGFTLIEQRDPGTPIGYTTSNFYDLEEPQVSADGRVLAFTATRPCGGGSGCIPVERYQGNILAPGKDPVTFAGRVALSRNGRYALSYGFTSMINPGPALLDVASGQSVKLPDFGREDIGPRRVADDGTVLGGSNPLVLARAMGVTRLYNTVAAEAAALAIDAARLIFRGRNGALYRYDIAAATQTEIAPQAAAFAISGDASTVVYAAGNRLFAGATELAEIPDGIADLTLSDNGRVAFASTNAGRLLRIDVIPANLVELVPRTPYVSKMDPLVPGSFVRISGTGLPDSGTFVKLGGVPSLVLAATPEEVRIQVPWDTVTVKMPFELGPNDSPFESGPQQVEIRPHAPWFFTSSDGLSAIAAHQNFEGLVTNDAPAREGEIVHFYMSGLGPVSPAGTLIEPLRCTMPLAQPINLQVPYAGLAPTLTGIYQVSVLLPPGSASGSNLFTTIECGFTDATAFTVIPVADR